ncbi:hypothetical protein TRVA0_003S04126 [Trichomonascus vanleenenianus]|uniref:uncharacterized protein n=1 Tax=Trichomonascus vanleenenianus TaxID=2268995 RepID=UPI003ECB74A8
MLARPMEHLSSPTKVREQKHKEYMDHLKRRRELAALRARGGTSKMEDDYLKAQYEREIARERKAAEDYRLSELEADDMINSNDYCHGGYFELDEEELLEQYLEQEQEEIESLLEMLDINQDKKVESKPSDS